MQQARGLSRAKAEGDDQVRRGELTQLRWLATVVPGAAVLLYETARSDILQHLLPGVPPQVGNMLVGVDWLAV
jgi:hypothetical protein